jgi:hypothetical protein
MTSETGWTIWLTKASIPVASASWASALVLVAITASTAANRAIIDVSLTNNARGVGAADGGL